jgi:hypothetical protein
VTLDLVRQEFTKRYESRKDAKNPAEAERAAFRRSVREAQKAGWIIEEDQGGTKWVWRSDL